MESEATRQDVECAVHVGMTTQVSIDDMQLFVCEVTDQNLEDEYMKEINESADKCYDPEITMISHVYDCSWNQNEFNMHER